MIRRCSKCGRTRPRRSRCSCGEALAPGTILAGRYLIVRAVGRGAAATVYHALDRMLDEPVALKLLDAQRSGPGAAARLRSEIKLARRVTHPNVCRIYEYGEDGDRRFISMELIEGSNLREVLAGCGRLAAGVACAVAAQAADALEAIHARGIVHRDVKTANLIQDAAGRVYVTDFGIATGAGPGTAGLAAGYVAGTPEYMSPEQAQGLRLDARSDLYALGVVLFELLTGDVPFRGASTAETLVGHVQQAPPLAALGAAQVPGGVRALVARLLAKSREDRPGSAAEVASALRAFAVEVQPMRSEADPAATTVVSKTLTLSPRRADPLAGGAALAAAVLAAAWTSASRVVPSEQARPAVSAPSSLPAAAVATLPPAGRHAPPVRRAGSPERLPRREAATEPLPAREVARLQPPLAVDTPAAVEPAPLDIAPPTFAMDEAAAPSAQGRLQLGIAPWADVTVDGVPIGTTPLAPLPLSAGTHTARLVHPDFRPLVRKVTIRPGETTPLAVDLRLDGIRNR